MDREGRVRSFLEQRLSVISQRPDMWGPPLAVELQVLTLVETWHTLHGKEEDFVHATMGRFQRFLFERLGEDLSLPLSKRLGLEQCADERFSEILSAFITSECGPLRCTLQAAHQHLQGDEEPR